MKHSVPAVEADGGDLSQFISTASMLIPTSQSRSTRVIWKIMSPRPIPVVLIIIILDPSAFFNKATASVYILMVSWGHCDLVTEAGGHEERVRMGIRRPQSVCNEKRTELCYLRLFEFSRFIELLELHIKGVPGEHWLWRTFFYGAKLIFRSFATVFGLTIFWSGTKKGFATRLQEFGLWGP